MKSFAIIAGASFAAVAFAQIGDLPPCALTCATESIGQTGCDLTDVACICSSSDYLTSLEPCVEDACTPSEQQQALAAAQAICASAGVTISVPAATSAPATSAAASSTPAVTSAPAASSASVSAPVNGTSSYAPVSATGAANKDAAGVAGVIGAGILAAFL